MHDRRKTCTETPVPCTTFEFYALAVPMACLAGAVIAVTLSWL